MIPKLVCFIFGHKRTWKDFTGEYGTKWVMGEMVSVPINIEREYKRCPRCGKNL